MRTFFIWAVTWTLIYVQWRFGLTLNRLFVLTFLIGFLVSIYFALWLTGSALLTLKSSKLLLHPLKYYRRKLLVSLMISTLAFYGFYRTQVPGQLEAYKAMADEKIDEFLSYEKRYGERVEKEEEVIEYNTTQREKLIDETSLEALKNQASNFNPQEILKEISTGWNKETADTEIDEVNWEKATDLIKKYPDYIHSAQENWISASKALEKPQNYYGKVVNFKGKIYSVEQLPPDDSVAKFFGGNCYHAMLAVRDNNKPVLVSVHIIGTSDGVEEDSVVNVKGYIYGHSKLINSRGDNSNGLAFVGFQE
ncbi:MAG: hypothetical protein IKZ53_10315 [Selenomonadaceae bacterium]|nr:hypothetical protein [Selenomonadaceae bacterium]